MATYSENYRLEIKRTVLRAIMSSGSGEAPGVLSASVALKRSRAESLDRVRRLNCWGCDLTDVSVLEQLANVEVLNLSCNSVTSLKALRACHNLTELYVRKNRISDLQELEYLRHLTNLQVLWLSDNPICQDPDYRQRVIQLLPQLKKLDNKMVLEEERVGSSEAHRKKTNNVLTAVLCLLPELDGQELAEVAQRIQLLQNHSSCL